MGVAGGRWALAVAVVTVVAALEEESLVFRRSNGPQDDRNASATPDFIHSLLHDNSPSNTTDANDATNANGTGAVSTTKENGTSGSTDAANAIDTTGETGAANANNITGETGAANTNDTTGAINASTNQSHPDGGNTKNATGNVISVYVAPPDATDEDLARRLKLTDNETTEDLQNGTEQVAPRLLSVDLDESESGQNATENASTQLQDTTVHNDTMSRWNDTERTSLTKGKSGSEAPLEHRHLGNDSETGWKLQQPQLLSANAPSKVTTPPPSPVKMTTPTTPKTTTTTESATVEVTTKVTVTTTTAPSKDQTYSTAPDAAQSEDFKDEPTRQALMSALSELEVLEKTQTPVNGNAAPRPSSVHYVRILPTGEPEIDRDHTLRSAWTMLKSHTLRTIDESIGSDAQSASCNVAMGLFKYLEDSYSANTHPVILLGIGLGKNVNCDLPKFGSISDNPEAAKDKERMYDFRMQRSMLQIYINAWNVSDNYAASQLRNNLGHVYQHAYGKGAPCVAGGCSYALPASSCSLVLSQGTWQCLARGDAQGPGHQVCPRGAVRCPRHHCEDPAKNVTALFVETGLGFAANATESSACEESRKFDVVVLADEAVDAAVRERVANVVDGMAATWVDGLSERHKCTGLTFRTYKYDDTKDVQIDLKKSHSDTTAAGIANALRKKTAKGEAGCICAALALLDPSPSTTVVAAVDLSKMGKCPAGACDKLPDFNLVLFYAAGTDAWAHSLLQTARKGMRVYSGLADEKSRAITDLTRDATVSCVSGSCVYRFRGEWCQRKNTSGPGQYAGCETREPIEALFVPTSKKGSGSVVAPCASAEVDCDAMRSYNESGAHYKCAASAWMRPVVTKAHCPKLNTPAHLDVCESDKPFHIVIVMSKSTSLKVRTAIKDFVKDLKPDKPMIEDDPDSHVFKQISTYLYNQDMMLGQEVDGMEKTLLELNKVPRRAAAQCLCRSLDAFLTKLGPTLRQKRTFVIWAFDLGPEYSSMCGGDEGEKCAGLSASALTARLGLFSQAASPSEVWLIFLLRRAAGFNDARSGLGNFVAWDGSIRPDLPRNIHIHELLDGPGLNVSVSMRRRRRSAQAPASPLSDIVPATPLSDAVSCGYSASKTHYTAEECEDKDHCAEGKLMNKQGATIGKCPVTSATAEKKCFDGSCGEKTTTTGTTTTTTTTTTNKSPLADEEKKTNKFWWWWIIVVVLVVLLLIIIIISCICCRKKRPPPAVVAPSYAMAPTEPTQQATLPTEKTPASDLFALEAGEGPVVLAAAAAADAPNDSIGPQGVDDANEQDEINEADLSNGLTPNSLVLGTPNAGKDSDVSNSESRDTTTN